LSLVQNHRRAVGVEPSIESFGKLPVSGGGINERSTTHAANKAVVPRPSTIDIFPSGVIPGDRRERNPHDFPRGLLWLTAVALLADARREKVSQQTPRGDAELIMVTTANVPDE
jgi:hypothetical protein